MSYPQIYVISKFQEFIQTLSGVGKPLSVDQAYIKKLGYKSSYEAHFLSAIKNLGLVEEKRGGGPTERWSLLRTDLGRAMAEGLREGYSDLFDFYPDAHLRDEEALANFFRGNSDADADAVGRMVNAFVAVREIAKFGDEPEGSSPANQADNHGDNHGDGNGASERVAASKVTAIPAAPAKSSNGAVNLNIQLQLPSDASGEVYDKFFAAMKKHGLI